MRRVSFRRSVLAVILLSTVATSGCYGTFPLVRKLYSYNDNVSSDKWVKELFFLATGVLLPVYAVASLIDVVLLNSMEFWTGKSGVAAGPDTETRVLTRGNVTLTQTMTRLADARLMVLEETVDGQFRSRTTMRQPKGASMVTVETVYADGRIEKKSITADEAGALIVSDASGNRRVLAATEVAAQSARITQLQNQALATR